MEETDFRPQLAALHSTLASIATQHNDLIWTRFQTAIALQVAVLSGGLFLVSRGPGWLGGSVFIAGALVTLLTDRLVGRDHQVWKENLHLMDRMVREFIPASVQDKLGMNTTGAPLYLFASPRRGPFKKLKNVVLFRAALLAIMGVDIILTVLVFSAPNALKP